MTDWIVDDIATPPRKTDGRSRRRMAEVYRTRLLAPTMPVCGVRVTTDVRAAHRDNFGTAGARMRNGRLRPFLRARIEAPPISNLLIMVIREMDGANH
jgi:hypothetical protein